MADIETVNTELLCYTISTIYAQMNINKYVSLSTYVMNATDVFIYSADYKV